MPSFHLIRKEGSGVFGQVWSATCHPPLLSESAIAIKVQYNDHWGNRGDKIKKIQECGVVSWDWTDSVTRSSPEYYAIRALQGHPNILRLIGFDVALSVIVTELMDSNLELLVVNKSLSADTIQSYSKQLISGLEWCHSKLFIHGDVKTNNILIRGDSLRLGDFGEVYVERTSGYPNIDPNEMVTPNVRAPELLMDNTDWGTPIDMWAAGCVILQMLGMKDYALAPMPYLRTSVVHALGRPPNSDTLQLGDVDAAQYMALDTRDILDAYPTLAGQPMASLLRRLWCYRTRRWTATDALAHTWLKNKHHC
jgi:serine/threonine protein kinase